MGEEFLISSVDPSCPIACPDGIGRGGGIIRHDDLSHATEVLEGVPVGGQPVRLAFIDAPASKDHAGVRQGGDKHADAGGPAGDRVGNAHLGAGPVDLHRMPRDVLDPSGEPTNEDFLADELTEAFIAVVSQALWRGQGQVVGPQDVQGCLLASGSGSDHRIHVDDDELPGDGHPAVTDQGGEVVVVVSVELGRGGDPVLVEGLCGFGDGGVRGTAASLNCSVGTARQQQVHDQPVVGHG